MLYLHQDGEGGEVWDLVFTSIIIRKQGRPSVLGEWFPDSILERTVLNIKMSRLLHGLLGKKIDPCLLFDLVIRFEGFIFPVWVCRNEYYNLIRMELVL